MIVVPGSEIFHYLFSVPNFHRRRVRVITVCILFAATIVVVLCFLPIPLGTRAEGVIWVPEQSFVRAGTEGFVERTVAIPGQWVKKGDPLIECSDPLLPAHIQVLESQLRELRAIYNNQIIDNLVQAGITNEEIRHVSAELDRARERARELTIRSGIDGLFIVPMAQDLPGRFVQRGELLAYVIDRSTITTRVVVEQSDIDFVRQRTRRVSVRLAEEIPKIVPAVLRREVPAATDQLPSRILGREGGGDIPIDPRDMQGVKAFQKVFLFDLELPETECLLKVGSRVYVRFDHGWEPLIWRWYRAARRLFIRRFSV
jgi:putative peptide zinc metalloprotease protein